MNYISQRDTGIQRLRKDYCFVNINIEVQEMTKNDFLALLNKDGYTVIQYIKSTNIPSIDTNGYKYNICKNRYLSGKKPDWLQHNPYAIDNIKNYLRINCPNFHLVSDHYHNCKEQLDFICDKHRAQGIQKRSVDNLVHLHRYCHYCAIEESTKMIDEETIMARAEDLGLQYIGRFLKHDHSGSIVQFICPVHTNKGVQTMAWDHFKNCAVGCPYCAGKYKTTVDFIDEIKDKSVNTIIIGEYTGLYNKIKCQCKKCGNVWDTTPASLKNGSGCPVCAFSHGERKIANLLNVNGIKYETQKTFDDCRHKQKLKFDFYLPAINVAIEFDGQQHFYPVDFANKGNKWAEQAYDKNILRDKIKNNYCTENNISLIRIPYYDYENIEAILTPVIQEYFLYTKQ